MNARTLGKLVAEKQAETDSLVGALPAAGVAGLTLPAAWRAAKGTVESGRRTVMDWLHPLTEQTGPLKNYVPQMGDITLHATREDLAGREGWQTLMRLLGGHPARSHASLMLPDAEGVMHAGVMTNLGGQARKYPRLSYLLNRLQKPGLSVTNFFNRIPSMANMDRAANAMNSRPGKVKDMGTLGEELKDHCAWPEDLHGNAAVTEVYRPKTPLTPEELEKMRGNVVRTAKMTVDEPSMYTAATRGLFGRGHNTGFDAPGTCAGGIANVMEGVRDLGHPSVVLPYDLAHNPAYERVFVRGAKDIMPDAKSVLRYGLGSTATRAGLATALGATGVYAARQAWKGLQDSHALSSLGTQVGDVAKQTGQALAPQLSTDWQAIKSLKG